MSREVSASGSRLPTKSLEGKEGRGATRQAILSRAVAASPTAAPKSYRQATKGLTPKTDRGSVAAKRVINWGNPKTLEDHFIRHGKDFQASSPEGYAQQASEFFRRSQSDGLPTKVDTDGVIRVYDRKTNTFGSFNPDGTTRTFLKPTSQTFFDRQPGRLQ